MPGQGNGPSSDAWGTTLTAPQLVSHQGLLLAFAREAGCPTTVLYFQVLDPQQSSSTTADPVWNGWYRFDLPGAPSPQAGANWQREQPAPELRLAGMDLLTVTPPATTVRPADASFQITSDGQYLVLARPSTTGSVYLNRLVVQGWTEDVGGVEYSRYALEVAWEVRYQRSGVRDVPSSDTDSLSSLDLTGAPFLEPTIELSRVAGASGGAFALTRVTTADPGVVRWYVACSAPAGVRLFSFAQTDDTVTDFTSSAVDYPLLAPASGGKALPPVAGLAPALVMYAEQDPSPDPAGEQVEVQRAARLMLAIAVSGAALGSGLDRATVVYDFGLDQSGLIPVLDAAAQAVVLVDGAVVDGAFQPDLTSPGFPTAAQAPQVSHVINGLVVTGLLLGQLQPHTDLSARMAEDGLVHLYCGGPLATVDEALAGWRSLVPGEPQAMAAQFDPRVSRVVITVPWAYAAPTEQGPGNVGFVARQAGPVMTGATVAVSDAQLGGQPQPDLCDVVVSYPAATGMGAETWHGVPREVSAFAAVLNGAATDDSADPAALNGSRPFFDFAGKLPLARLPIPPLETPLIGFAPAATVVSTRTTLGLQQVEVSQTGGQTQLSLAFTPATGVPITAVWPALPTVLDSWADILAGSASASVYPYTPGTGTSHLYGLATDAPGVAAPVLFHPLTAAANTTALTVEVTPSATGGLDVSITGGPEPVALVNVPSAAPDFAAAVSADAGFGRLNLVIDIEGVAGNVLPTPAPAGPMDLRAICALFDVLMPEVDVSGCSAPAGTYRAGTQQHLPASGPAGDLVRLAGFACAPELPVAGIPAYVRNQAAGLTAAGVNRQLHGADAAAPAVSGVWARQAPPLACSFTGTDNVSVPVASQGAALPASLNLRPQWDWTLEAWVQPSNSVLQRVITFADTVTAWPATAPALGYQISLKGQDVIGFSAYSKQPGQPDSCYFQANSSTAAEFLRPGAFSWECWIQPQSTATPGADLLGGIIQVQSGNQSVPAFAIGLNANRRVVLRVSPDGSNTTDLVGSATVPALNSGGLPVWTHVAVVGAQQHNGSWTLSLHLNARPDSTFTAVTLQQDLVGTFLVIGSNTVDDASMFGKLASLRFWGEARTPAEIRRTAFASLAGTEAGLLGCWPMTGLQSGGPTGSYLANTAVLTGTDWNAAYYDGKQPMAPVQDDYFLSMVASVAGLPPVEAHAVLPNDRWNHLAVVFQGGGALALNPPERFGAGQYDWARAPGENLNPSSAFAVDAWVQLPAPTAQDATILSHWAWDDSPENQCFQLAIDPAGNLALKVKLISTNAGDTKVDTLTSSGLNLADGTIRHVAAVFAGVAATNQSGSTATYSMTLYADGKVIGSMANGTLQTSTVQLVTSQTDVLIGRGNLAPAGAEQAVESMGLFCGTLGQLRFWSGAPAVADLFPEKSPTRPHFSTPRGLAASWAFRDQQGVVAADPIGGNDAILTSSAPWSGLRSTSTLRFLANGAPVSSVVPYTDPLPGATTSQFSFGAPLETGVQGLVGSLGQVSLWEVARDPVTIRGQQFTPRTGDEAGLVACWDFSDGGADLTGGGNDPNPAIDPHRIKPADLPVTNEGALVRNAYGGQITDLSATTPGRIAVGSFAEAAGAGAGVARAVLRRQYLLDPNASMSRPIDVGLLDLVYVGQVQTDPVLIGYIEGAPPVPSENLSRPYYLSQTSPLYTSYTGTSSVTLTQQSSRKVSYSSSTTTTTDIDFKAAIGIFGIESSAEWSILLMNKSAYDLKSTVQAVAAAKATYGTTEGTDLSGEWTSVQRDTLALKGEWEPFQSDPRRYLNPQVGRRFEPANLGYALVESLTADLFAMVYHRTGAAVGTMIIPNPAIPPDRNLLLFPMNAKYTKNGTLDGKVGLVNDPAWRDADARRGSYFQPAEAYALAASIEAQNQRRQAYASQFDWKARGQEGRASLSDAQANLPVDFASEPASGNQIAAPRTGIANRYVWSADKGLHVEAQGFASVSSRSYTGWRNRGGGGGIKAQGEVFFYLGFAYSLDLLVTHMVDVHVGLKTDDQQSVSLDVTVDGEAYLPAWDPDADAVYGGGKGAFRPGLGPGKVQQYRFFSFLLPASRDNADHFGAIVDPVWRTFSNDPTARALRELSTPNPVWRVLHRVTYVERVPPPLATRPVYTSSAPAVEPANLAGNIELLNLITDQINAVNPTSAQVGAAVAAALNPAPTSPGVYPASLLERTVPWWRAFLDAARPRTGGPAPDPQAAALLTDLVTRVVRYVVAGYRTSVLPLKQPVEITVSEFSVSVSGSPVPAGRASTP